MSMAAKLITAQCQRTGTAPDTLQSGFVHEPRQRLYMGLGGAQIHGRVMFTSFVNVGVFARTASGCSR